MPGPEKDRAGMELDLRDARQDLGGAVKGKAVYQCRVGHLSELGWVA